MMYYNLLERCQYLLQRLQEWLTQDAFIVIVSQAHRQDLSTT